MPGFPCFCSNRSSTVVSLNHPWKVLTSRRDPVSPRTWSSLRLNTGVYWERIGSRGLPKTLNWGCRKEESWGIRGLTRDLKKTLPPTKFEANVTIRESLGNGEGKMRTAWTASGLIKGVGVRPRREYGSGVFLGINQTVNRVSAIHWV